jgi:hypothetical protein
VDAPFNTSRNFDYSAYTDGKLQFVPPRKNEAGIAWGNPHNIFSIGDLNLHSANQTLATVVLA